MKQQLELACRSYERAIAYFYCHISLNNYEKGCKIRHVILIGIFNDQYLKLI